MDQLLEKIDQLLSGHTALIDGMTEHVMGRYVRQLENFNRQLDTFKRGMLERVHDMESKSTKLENQIGKSNYLLGKLEKEIERRKDLIERLNKDFEENRQIGQTETEKELRKFRKDAAERMLTEFKEVAIAERDVETIIDMIHEISFVAFLFERKNFHGDTRPKILKKNQLPTTAQTAVLSNKLTNKIKHIKTFEHLFSFITAKCNLFTH